MVVTGELVVLLALISQATHGKTRWRNCMPFIKQGRYLATALLLFSGAVFHQNSLATEHGVIIGFHEQPGPGQRELILDLGGQISREYSLIPAIAAKIPTAALAALSSHPLVAYVEEDAEIGPIKPSPSIQSAPAAFTAASTEDEYGRSWGVQHIGSKMAHLQGITGKGVKIAVIDSGIDYNHEDLDGNYQGGYDFVFDDDDPMDDSLNSHGTHVAGIIAAEKNGIGVVGVAPEASLYSLKVLPKYGTALTSNIVAAFQWAVDNQMDIINISIEGGHSETLQAACDAAYDAGLLIVAAAGNTSGQSARYPASYSSVIAVTNTDQNNNLANTAPISPEIELSAPGEAVLSTAQTAETQYRTLSGTSQSAPHVAGMAALLIASGNLQDINNDGKTDNRDLRLKLQEAVDDLGEPGRDELFGYGLVNVGKMFSATARIRLEKSEQWLAGWETYAMENRKHHVSIQNDSLYGIISWVSENGRFRRDLSAVHIFQGYKQQLPRQVDFELDATATTLEVIFIPFGKTASFADITIY